MAAQACSTSTGVALGSIVTRPRRGRSTWSTLPSWNSSAPETRPYSSSSSRPSRRDSSTSPATSSWENVEATSSLGSMRTSRTARLAMPLSSDDERPEHGDDGEHERPEEQRRPVGTDQGEVLRHHLAEHDVGEDHDRHARSTNDDRCAPARPASRAPRTPAREVRDRRLADRTEAEGADGDAELRRSHGRRDVLHGAQREPRRARAGLGRRLELGAARRDERELRSDEQARSGPAARARSTRPSQVLMTRPPVDGGRRPS